MAKARTHIGVSPETVARLDAMRAGILASASFGGCVPCEETEPVQRQGRPTITYDALINVLLDQREGRAARRARSKRRKGAARPRLPKQAPLPDAPQ